MKVKISEIVIGSRHRKDAGDIEELARNIKAVGLLQPICVTPDKRLIDGWRRLVAAKHLGWKAIPCHVHDLEKIVEGEFAATVHRKNYTISELAAIYREVKPMLEAEAHQRKVEGGRRGGQAKQRGKSPKPENRSDRKAGGRKKMGGRTRDLIERYSGGLWSGQMIERAAEICQAATDNPEKFGKLKQEMDDGKRSLTSAWRVYRAIKALDDVPRQPAPQPGKYENEILHGDCLDWLRKFEDNTFDACHTDPYFGVGFCYGDIVEPINRDPEAYWNWLKPIYEEIVRVLKPGGVIAIHQSEFYLDCLKKWYGEKIGVFAYCKNFVPIYNMGDFTWAWHPVVVTSKPGGKTLWPRKKVNTINHHTSTVPADDVARLHPCPLPPDFCERFLTSFTIEGGWVLDPFCGSGSIPLACVATGRRFTGIEQRQEYVELARKRLSMQRGHASERA
jgi:SAM-dependent methyltransferase